MATPPAPADSERAGTHPLLIVTATVLAEPDKPAVSVPLTIEVAQVDS